jgi:hypothetical protein
VYVFGLTHHSSTTPFFPTNQTNPTGIKISVISVPTTTNPPIATARRGASLSSPMAEPCATGKIKGSDNENKLLSIFNSI